MLTKTLWVACLAAAWVASAQAPKATQPQDVETVAPLHARTPADRALLDAKTAIARITGTDPEAAIEHAEGSFNQHLRNLIADGDKMAPKEAAERWLNLVDEGIALPHRSFNGAMGGAGPAPAGTLSTSMLALPPPSSWPEIQRLVEQRPPSVDRTVLQILFARLQGDDAKVVRLCPELDRQMAQRATSQDPPSSPAAAIRIAALIRMGQQSKVDIVDWIAAFLGQNGPEPYVVDVFPEAQARAAILRALINASKNPYAIPISFSNTRNVKLAQQVALDHLSELQKPPWRLALRLDDIGFIRRLVDHFGFATIIDPQNNAGEPTNIYFRWLLWTGKADLAAKMVQSLPNVGLSTGEYDDPPKNLLQTIAAVQKLAPKVDLSDLYLNAAEALGRFGDAIAYTRARATSDKIPHPQRLMALTRLMGLHERIGDLKSLAADYAYASKIPRVQGDYDPTYGRLGIGLAAGDHGLIEAGVSDSLKVDQGYIDPNLFQALADEHRLGDLERLCVRAFRRGEANKSDLSSPAMDLAEVYYRANRPAEVMKLLERFPYWPAKDLSTLNVGSYLLGDWQAEDVKPVEINAAWAFMRIGRKDLAVRMLRQALLEYAESSASYTLLNSIVSSPAIYDQLIRAHPLSPAPWLWKGDLMFRLGRGREAEVCLRKALAMDPDASMPYRRKLNSLLASILLKKGEMAGFRHAETLAEAIDLQMRAKKLSDAGLLSMAEAALKTAAAMCPFDAPIQSDYADLLIQENRPAEAMPHRVLAIEHLTSAIGESSGEFALRAMVPYSVIDQPDGMRLLDGLVKGNPSGALAHYARGMALAWLDRPKEAIADFRAAVTLDPKIFCAWTGLATALRTASASPRLAADAEIATLRLAPYDSAYDASTDLGSVSDVRLAYSEIQRRLSTFPVFQVTPLFPLHCEQPQRQGITWPTFDRLSPAGRVPGAVIANSSDIRAIIDLYHPTRFPFE